METVYEKHTEQGCGDCPSGKIHCNTCSSSLCNMKEFAESNIFMCNAPDWKKTLCSPSVNECNFGIRVRNYFYNMLLDN